MRDVRPVCTLKANDSRMELGWLELSSGSLKRKRGVGSTACLPSLARSLSFEALCPFISSHPSPSLALQASCARSASG